VYLRARGVDTDSRSARCALASIAQPKRRTKSDLRSAVKHSETRMAAGRDSLPWMRPRALGRAWFLMFGKFFAQTFTGSMRGAGSDVFAVWSYVIANMRYDNSIEMNHADVAARIGMTTAEVDAAVAFLCAPDQKSRTPDHDGRRLLHDGAFLYTVVNGAHYRAIRNEDERREYFKLKKRESRARLREPGEDDQP